MTNEDLKQKLINKISNSKKIAIFGHDYVDGDCIGSMLWLWSILQSMDKSISYFTSYEPSKTLSRIPKIDQIKTEFDYENYDIIFILDMNRINRMSKFYNLEYFQNQYTVIIDHHPWSQDISPNINILDTSASSACELIWSYIYEEYSDFITSDIATYFLLWIITDTNRYIYEKNSIKTLEISLQLLQKWANKAFILQNLENQYNQNQLNLLNIFIPRIQSLDWITYSYILDQDLQSQDISDTSEISYLRQFISQYTWTDLSIFITQKDIHKLDFSMRAKKWSAWYIARKFGGWWHDNAASFAVVIWSQNISKIIKQNIKKITSFYKKFTQNAK